MTFWVYNGLPTDANAVCANREKLLDRRMREIRTSGGTRAAELAPPLLYRPLLEVIGIALILSGFNGL